jgi:hypothetical protein
MSPNSLDYRKADLFTTLRDLGAITDVAAMI